MTLVLNAWLPGEAVRHILEQPHLTLCGTDLRDNQHDETHKPWWIDDDGRPARDCGLCLKHLAHATTQPAPTDLTHIREAIAQAAAELDYLHHLGDEVARRVHASRLADQATPR